MDEMKRVWRETSLERPEKTPDGREESLLLSRVRKQSESEDGGMRELREIFEFVEVGKHSRGKGCQLVVIEMKNK